MHCGILNSVAFYSSRRAQIPNQNELLAPLANLSPDLGSLGATNYTTVFEFEHLDYNDCRIALC